jgi:quinoprotein dehydrogenase-associated probable ABC transporter substrate-binding protein
MAPLIAQAGTNCPCAEDGKDEHADAPAKTPKTPIKELRVCADPSNLPFSNREHEGFEDKIAAVVARDLGLPLNYDWLPQRLGFYRTALKTFDSNLVMAAPGGFDKALITDPYYRSTYVFVQRKDTRTPIRSFDDAALRNVKIGVQLTGGVNAPPTHALAHRQIIDNITGFPVFDETQGKPAEKIVTAVANGQIDVAVVWGPQAGYFAKRQSVPLDVTPVAPQQDKMGDAVMSYTFEICMALRRPDKSLRDRINGVIANRRSEIERILDEFNVCRLPLAVAGSGTTFGGKT